MGASLKQIKNRIKSVDGTRQITKAMELVSTLKLRRAKERAENVRPYHDVLAEAIVGLQAGVAESPTVFAVQREVKKTCYVVIGGDRGLAGGYNANLFRLAKSLFADKIFCVLPVGKKALDYYIHCGSEILSSAFEYSALVGVGDCVQMAELLCRGFADGSYDRVCVVYTKFNSMLSQTPVSEEILPLDLEGVSGKNFTGSLIEGSADDLIAKIVPQYVSGILFAALCEATASEHGARRTAMNAANKNADEIIDSLMLKYNRARQAMITQEITEIVSGAEAL